MNAHETKAPSRLLATMAMIFMIFPLLAVIPVSFTSKRFLSMPNGNWSLRHYQALLDSPEWLSAISQSLIVATATCIIATALAVSFSLGIWYLRSRLATLLIGLVLLPMAIPPMISAMVLYFMETKVSQFAPGLGYDTLVGLTIAHIVMVVPYGVVTMLVALSQLDRRIELAARNLGASLGQTTFMVVLPNLKLGVASTALLCFALSWEEIAVTLFVTSTEVNTLPRQIWSGLRDNIDPAVAAISVVLIALTFVALIGRMIAQKIAARPTGS
ncbi:ABC transporter permease [Pseudomonas nitroreducens]|uniref:ABC transporter permease n=1 Tax=Pseudomonas nitroreducens TaxID=46680 RepID=UPI0026590379|nr:ABC transporter permease [Pseudomonas nitroreducens]MCP1647848.1 putative spermidine/putrescine transport system permease protein [Pseudomonas nitroreducens]MCP1686424.1 putative spermidine/putrescine transport system permease protein [Pseudomonas nitroreducens]